MITTPARVPLSAPMRLPPVEALDDCSADVLVGVATQAAALHARAMARLTVLHAGAAPTATPPDPDPDSWLTAQEVAASRKVPVSWVRENARRGKLRCHKLGRYVRFQRSELDEDLRALERGVRGV